MKLSGITGKITKAIKNPIALNPDSFAKIGQNVNSFHQRLAIGGTALFMQPPIDLSNKKVDEETRTLNACRSVSRAIIGTITGLGIRYAFIKGAQKFGASAQDKILKEGSTAVLSKLENFFCSDDFKKQCVKARSLVGKELTEARGNLKESVKHFGNSWGTALALTTIFFTNFLIDAPGINFLSGKMHKKFCPQFYPQSKGVENEASV